MNFEELNDPETRRKATNYLEWMKCVDQLTAQVEDWEVGIQKWRDKRAQVMAMTEQERQEFKWLLE